MAWCLQNLTTILLQTVLQNYSQTLFFTYFVSKALIIQLVVLIWHRITITSTNTTIVIIKVIYTWIATGFNALLINTFTLVLQNLKIDFISLKLLLKQQLVIVSFISCIHWQSDQMTLLKQITTITINSRSIGSCCIYCCCSRWCSIICSY